MFSSYQLIIFQWLVQANMVEIQQSLEHLPRQVIKDKVNQQEHKHLFVYRMIQITLFAVLCAGELIGVNPGVCNSNA